MAELQAQKITSRIPDYGSRHLEFRVTGPRFCPYQPPVTAHIGYALVLLLQQDENLQGRAQEAAGSAGSTGRCTSGSLAWDLEAQGSSAVAYTVPRAGEVVVSLHDPRTSWSPLQSFNQAAQTASEGAVLLYMSVEDAVLKTPVHQVLRGLERARVHAQASQLSAGCLRVGVFKAWNAAGVRQPARKAGCGSQRIFSFVQLQGVQPVPAAFAARFQGPSGPAPTPGAALGAYLTDSYATQQVQCQDEERLSAATEAEQEDHAQAPEQGLCDLTEQPQLLTQMRSQHLDTSKGTQLTLAVTSKEDISQASVTRRVRQWQLPDNSGPGPLAVACAALAESAAEEARAEAARKAPPVNKSARWRPGSCVARAKAAMLSALPPDLAHPSSLNGPPTRQVSAHTEGVIDSSLGRAESNCNQAAAQRSKSQGPSLATAAALQAAGGKSEQLTQRGGHRGSQSSSVHTSRRGRATPLNGCVPTFASVMTQASLARARSQTQALVEEVARMEEELRFTRGV